MNLIRANVTGNLGMLFAWLFITGINDQDWNTSFCDECSSRLNNCSSCSRECSIRSVCIMNLSATSQHDTHFEPWLRLLTVKSQDLLTHQRWMYSPLSPSCSESNERDPQMCSRSLFQTALHCILSNSFSITH